jgi:hypothetical protein
MEMGVWVEIEEFGESAPETWRLGGGDHAVGIGRFAADTRGEVLLASVTTAAPDAGLDHHPGPHRIRHIWALNRDPPHHLVSGDQWIYDVTGLALPDLDVRA